MEHISNVYNWEVITPQAGSYLFGYYDRFALDKDNKRHLALHIPQQDHLPLKGECAQVGYVDLARKEFVPLAETQSWCHQQGSMSLWLTHKPGHFIYNDYRKDGAEWQPVSRIINADTGEIAGEYAMPVYALSSDGRWGACLDFGRIPRRGYSYARAQIPQNKPVPDLDSDGLFLLDMHSGESKLIASYRQMLKAHPCAYDLEGQYIWLNHAIFNRDASRLMVLLRHRKDPFDNGEMWKTHMLTMGLDGQNMLCPLPDMLWMPGRISHQIWGRGPREILIDAQWCGNGHEYVVFDESERLLRAERISKGMGPMGHLVFSPDGQWMAADTYRKDGWQSLALVHTATGEITEIGRFRHPEVNIEDLRCDLHPRWSRDGKYITVDTLHFGERKICLLDVSEIAN